jgi:hypothetical protein
MNDIGTWLKEQIEASSPEATEDTEAAFRMAMACAALSGANASAFGMDVPADLANRDELKALAIDALKRWLPKLDPDGKERLKKMLSEYKLTGT